jgi:hypothetical protein
VVGVPLTREQEARVRLTIASMFVSPDIRADNARQALALPSLPDDLRNCRHTRVHTNLREPAHRLPTALVDMRCDAPS